MTAIETVTAWIALTRNVMADDSQVRGLIAERIWGLRQDKRRASWVWPSVTFRQAEPYVRCRQVGLSDAGVGGVRPDYLACWLSDGHDGEHWDTEHELVWTGTKA